MFDADRRGQVHLVGFIRLVRGTTDQSAMDKSQDAVVSVSMIPIVHTVATLVRPSQTCIAFSCTHTQIGYEFSSDPDTREVERKVRRMAGRQARRGADLERIFTQYDSERSGTVLRAEFVQVRQISASDALGQLLG